jgi:hypothetical protein
MKRGEKMKFTVNRVPIWLLVVIIVLAPLVLLGVVLLLVYRIIDSIIAAVTKRPKPVNPSFDFSQFETMMNDLQNFSDKTNDDDDEPTLLM